MGFRDVFARLLGHARASTGPEYASSNSWTSQNPQSVELDPSRFSDAQFEASYKAAPVQLTPEAAEEIRRCMREQKMPATACVKVGIIVDTGFRYSLDVMEFPTKTLLLTRSQGLSIGVESDRRTLMLLRGVVLDYSRLEKGFRFNNPNAA